MFDLNWVAMFEDGSLIKQFDSDGKEHLYKEVLDQQDKLWYFFLSDDEKRVSYAVNLKNGCISFGREGDELLEPREDMLRSDKTYTYRLIYFRQVERFFGTTLQQELEAPKITFFLGFQYLDENNKNQKRLMKIHSDGRWTIN